LLFRRSYYLIVALNEKGEMIFEEDREGTGGAFGAHIKDRNFLNGARHSVYYKRTESSSILMVNCFLRCMNTLIANDLFINYYYYFHRSTEIL